MRALGKRKSMSKRELRRHAHGQVAAIIQSHIDGGSYFELFGEDDYDPDLLDDFVRQHIKPIRDYHARICGWRYVN